MGKTFNIDEDPASGQDRGLDKHADRDFRSASDFLRSLITERKLARAARELPLLEGAIRVIGDAATTGADQERLEAISLLGKVAETSRVLGTLIEPLISNATYSPLPHTRNWGTADDRYYLAKALSGAHQNWLGEYAAVELAQGEVAEKSSRDVWARLAISRGESLSRVIDIVADAISTDTHQTHSPTETAFRKLNRSVLALSEQISDLDYLLGEGCGESLLKLISGIAGRGGPENASLRVDTALTFLEFVIRITRVRFNAGLDRDLYRAASVALGWWKPARPPEAVLLCAERLARIGIDCLHTLARQGVLQSRLRQALSSSLGAALVNRIGSETASRDPSLSHVASSWLSKGITLTERTTGTAVQELNDRDLDDLASRLLLELDIQEGGIDSLNGAVELLDILEPAQADVVRAAAKRIMLIEQWAQAIIAKRRLVISGRRGEIVTFDPALHEGDPDLMVGGRARLLVPGVNKKQDGRQEVAILKPMVTRY